jgi:hypothetical protein
MKHMGTVISLSLPWVFAASSNIGPTWPAADYLWSPVMVDGNLYVDAQADAGDYYAGKPSQAMDIVGGTDPQGDGPFAAGFWVLGPTDLMFRIRVDGDPGQSRHVVWSALLNTDADSDVDWVLQLDLSTDDQVELVEAVSGGPDNGWDITLANPPHVIGYDRTLYSRFSNASGPLYPPFTGSHFHGSSPADADYFVDLAIPLADFITLTGWNPGDPLGIAFSTSAPHLTTSQDRPDYSGWDVPTTPVPDVAILAHLGTTAIRYVHLVSTR